MHIGDGEGDELISVAEDNCIFSGVGLRGVANVFQKELSPDTALVLGAAVADDRAFLGPYDGERRRVRAEDVTVQGANGANGSDNFDQFGDAGTGDVGGSATANAGSLHVITSPLNNATAIGGSGGTGGINFGGIFGLPGLGGTGGAAKATAATTLLFGSADADAESTGGSGGRSGTNSGPAGLFNNGGSGGAATAIAVGSSASGKATASASAVGGQGGLGEDRGGGGGNANASSTARAGGLGDALSSANATGGESGQSFDTPSFPAGNATAMADASAAGGGKAIATAVATGGPAEFSPGSANATSNAMTTNGAMAQALSTAVVGAGQFLFPSGEASSTAKTSFAGVTTTATAAISQDGAATEMTDAIAQGGSGQISLTPNVGFAAISTAVPDKAYATTLIHGASNVADALLGPGDEIFGTSILEFGSSTFDFSYQGDLLLGVIGGFADITVNGAEIFSGDPEDDTVINLGFMGPNIDLTISGFGTFVIGGVVPGAVPEASTWAMLLLGFGGLGLVGYRQTRGAKPQAA